MARDCWSGNRLEHTAFDRYLPRRFREAVEILHAVRALWPDGGPTVVLPARVEQCLRAFPPEDWDGAFDRTA